MIMGSIQEDMLVNVYATNNNNNANYQRNANENSNEIPPHTCQNDYHQNVYK